MFRSFDPDNWTFGYNPASQIATETRSNDAYAPAVTSGSTAYTPNGLNQYGSVGGTTYTYDANGNLKTDGTNTYTFDIENRLVKAVAGGTTANLVYDPLGRLYQTDQGTNGSTTRFLTDGDAMALEYNSNNAVIARYVHGSNAAAKPAPAKAGDPLVWFDGSNLNDKMFLHADHLGSIVAWTNSSGGSPTINKYDEYGVPAATNTGRFQYTGQAWIGELSLYYYKARFYSPSLGRFLQTDPVGYRGGVNLYAYVENNPLNANDPSGMAPGDPFNSAEAAAVDALDYINPKSVSENVEYSGVIQYRDGYYYASTPVKGTREETRPTRINRHTDVAWYHTHGDYTDAQGRRTSKMRDDRNSDAFSVDDVIWTEAAAEATEKRNFKGFLGTPSKVYWRYDAGTNRTSRIGQDERKKRVEDQSSDWFDLGGIMYGNRARGTRIGCPKGENVC